MDEAGLREGRTTGLSDAQMIENLKNAMNRLAAFDVRKQLERQIDGIKRNPGKRKSWRFKNRAPRRS